MKKVRKLQRHFMVLALTASLAGLNSWGIFAGSLTPTPSTPKDVAGKDASGKGTSEAVDTEKQEGKGATCDKASGASVKFDISKGFSSIAEKAIPAVVNVSTTQIIEGGRAGKEGVPQFAPGTPFEDFFKEFFDQMERPRKVQSLGSGFIIQSDDVSATIVTNYHVIADAKKVTIFLDDNTEFEATVVAFDERTDLALLKIKVDSLPANKRKLPTLEWGDSHTVKVGDWIVAIGNPFGLGGTVTTGIISNRARDIALGSRGGRNRADSYVDDFMQHSAAINMGNSGGPLLDLEGRVIGINTAIFSPSGGNIGIGFAIPAAVAQETVSQLLKFGRTKRGWLGVRIQAVTDDIAESLGLGKARGAIIGYVTPDGPAAKAKFEPEDIILEFDGKEVNEKTRLNRLVGETLVGKTVKVKVWRQGKEVTLNVVVGEYETAPDHAVAASGDKAAQASSQDVVEVLGVKLSALTPELRERFKSQISKDAKGIMVMKVGIDSPAQEIGLRGAERDRPGDIIEKVNQKEVTSPKEFAKAVEEAKKDNRKNILLLVIRDGEPRFVPLKLESEDLAKGAKDADSKVKKDNKAGG